MAITESELRSKRIFSETLQLRNYTFSSVSEPTEFLGVGLNLSGEDDGDDESVDGHRLAEDHRN